MASSFGRGLPPGPVLVLAAALVAGCGALPRGVSLRQRCRSSRPLVAFGDSRPALEGRRRAASAASGLDDSVPSLIPGSRPHDARPARSLAGALSDGGAGVVVTGGCFLPVGDLWKESYGPAIPAVGLGVSGPLGGAGGGAGRFFYLAALALSTGHDEVNQVGATRITGTLSQLDLQGAVCLGFGPGRALFLGAGGNVAVVREEVATEGFDDSLSEYTKPGYHALAGCRLGRFLVGATYRSGFDPEGVGVFGGLSF